MRELDEREERRRQDERRIAQQRERERVGAEYDRAHAELVARGRVFIERREGTLADLALALETDQIATLAALEDGVEVEIGAVKEIATATVDGRRFYRAPYAFSSEPASLRRRALSALQQSQFSWDNWSKQMDAASSLFDQINITCLFDSASEIPREPKRVHAELHSFAGSGGSLGVAFHCR